MNTPEHTPEQSQLGKSSAYVDQYLSLIHI